MTSGHINTKEKNRSLGVNLYRSQTIAMYHVVCHTSAHASAGDHTEGFVPVSTNISSAANDPLGCGGGELSNQASSNRQLSHRDTLCLFRLKNKLILL